MILCFELTMPNRGSWNGRWSEENDVHVITKTDRQIGKSRRRLLSDLKELIAAWKKYPFMAEQIKGVEAAIGYVQLIPSVKPERKPGKWEEKNVVYKDDRGFNSIEAWQSARCNKCGRYHTTPYMYYFNDYDFCPNCGAKMEGTE